MPRRSRRRRWLFFHAGQRSINASPMWRAGCPDSHCGPGKIRIVEGPNPNEDQMWSRLSLAKERSATIGAKSAVHTITTVCHTYEVARLPYDLERRGGKASANGSAAGAQVLAIAAPAYPRGDRRFRAFPADRAAQALTCQCHRALQGQRCGIARIVHRVEPAWRPRGVGSRLCAMVEGLRIREELA